MSQEQNTATVAVGVLRRSLASAAAALEPDHNTGLLDRIAVEAGRGVLVMTATNRYIAAHARCEATGTLREFGLSIPSVKALMFHLRGVDAYLDVTLTLNDNLHVDLPEAGLRLPLADLAGWPKMAKVFEPLPLELDLTDAAVFDLSTAVLARLSRVLPDSRLGQATHWYRAQATKPIMVEFDDWLTVAVMPMRRMTEGVLARVPFGIPVPEIAAKPARKRAAKAIVAAPKICVEPDRLEYRRRVSQAHPGASFVLPRPDSVADVIGWLRLLGLLPTIAQVAEALLDADGADERSATPNAVGALSDRHMSEVGA